MIGNFKNKEDAISNARANRFIFWKTINGRETFIKNVDVDQEEVAEVTVYSDGSASVMYG